ncbi:MAG: O-antigen ligase family protein [Salinivirgaceae bacterium]|nr:O-antigen ligase family protein [Salinivirgaceae bacterium]
MKSAIRILVILLIVSCHFVTTEISVWANTIFYLAVVLLSVYAVVVFWRSGQPLKINIPEILLVGFIAYLFTNNIINGSFWGNERLLNYLILLLLYFAFALLCKTDKGILNFIFYGLLAGITLELIVGFGQMFGIVPNSDTQFVLGGLFGNPGAFAGYLSIVSTFILATVFFQKQIFKSENYYYAAIFCFFCAVCLIAFSDSRGAWIAFLAGLAFVLNHKFEIIKSLVGQLKSKISKWITGIVLVLSIVFVGFALYQYKPDSAFGRLFVWKVSKTMILEKPMFGNGFGHFEACYGKTQAHYFLSHDATENEIQVADYVTCAYNEFLEILIESGIIGLLLFAAILYFALAKHCKPTYPKYYIAAKASLITLFILTLVSYPFRLIPNQLIFICCLFIVFRTGHFREFSITNSRKIFVTLWLSSVLCLSFIYSKHLLGMYHFHTGYAKVFSGDINNGIKDYEKAYKLLQNNGKFLFYYGSAFYLKQDYTHSIIYLKQATELTSNPNAFITLGNSLKELERYTEAEQAYKKASGITPSKLYPKYLLAQLYIKMQNTEKAIEMASSIVKAKEKVPTTAGMQIKEEMQKLIDQYNNLDVKPLKTNIMSP